MHGIQYWSYSLVLAVFFPSHFHAEQGSSLQDLSCTSGCQFSFPVKFSVQIIMTLGVWHLSIFCIFLCNLSLFSSCMGSKGEEPHLSLQLSHMSIIFLD